MACARVRRKLSCEDCGWSWEDKGLPSDADACKTCIRNPSPTQVPIKDNFVDYRDINYVMKVSK